MFSMLLVHGFWSKNGNFVLFVFFSKIGQKKVFSDLVDRKQAISRLYQQ